MGRRLVAVVVAVGALALVPVGRAAAEPSPQRVETFELPSPLVDPASPGGRLEEGRTVPKVHVLLPEGYGDDPDRRWPVLWLLHGANGGTDTWLPGITTLLDGLPAVVVMPDGGLFGMYVDWWNGGRRGGPAWATYHLDLLRRTIEERYRIRPERSWHSIAGISMGGQGALRYAAMLPGYFGTVIGFSAALPDMRALEAQGGVNLAALSGSAPGVTHETIFGPARGPYAAGNSAQALVANYEHTRMFLTSGNGITCPQDPIRPQGLLLDTVTETFIHLQQGPFARAARAAGALVTVEPACGIHTFGVWDRAFAEVRAWGIFGQVPERPASWTYRTIATAGEAWGLRFRFVAPPTEVVELQRSGGTLRAAGSGRVHVEGPAGCSFTADLPFERELPPACRRAS